MSVSCHHHRLRSTLEFRNIIIWQPQFGLIASRACASSSLLNVELELRRRWRILVTFIGIRARSSAICTAAASPHAHLAPCFAEAIDMLVASVESPCVGLRMSISDNISGRFWARGRRKGKVQMQPIPPHPHQRLRARLLCLVSAAQYSPVFSSFHISLRITRP